MLALLIAAEVTLHWVPGTVCGDRPSIAANVAVPRFILSADGEIIADFDRRGDGIGLRRQPSDAEAAAALRARVQTLLGTQGEPSATRLHGLPSYVLSYRTGGRWLRKTLTAGLERHAGSCGPLETVASPAGEHEPRFEAVVRSLLQFREAGAVPASPQGAELVFSTSPLPRSVIRAKSLQPWSGCVVDLAQLLPTRTGALQELEPGTPTGASTVLHWSGPKVFFSRAEAPEVEARLGLMTNCAGVIWSDGEPHEFVVVPEYGGVPSLLPGERLHQRRP